MKSSKISTLAAYTILLLVTGLLFACKPIFDKKPLPDKEGSKEVVSEPAPAPAPAPAASAPTPIEPATKIEEVETIQSLEFAVETPDATSKDAQVQMADDGDDVVKITPVIMRKVQQALVNAGLNPGPVDGVSGAKTVSAIESFQKQSNIPVGKLNKRTLRALDVDF